ncbi:MAG: hypothetical protein ABI674_00830 [Spartobacteria bacterium]
MRKAIISILLLLAFLTPAPAPAALLLNLSTRVEIPAPFLGQDVTSVIGGFIIGGTKSRKVLIRAIGPSLADFGLVPLADPTLVLYDSTGAVLASNDNWMDTQETDIRDTGLQPNDPLESAIVMTLTPGTYTAIVQGNEPVPGDPVPTSGTALVELYDLSPIIAEALDNLSTRGAVQGTADPMIAGFILGNGDNVTVLLRALGPSLIQFGLSGLSDPRLDLFDGEGNLLASNDNWQDTQSGDIAATGLAPADPFEAAILINLPRGTYTAVLSPVDAQDHGTALAELYKLE